MSGSKLIEREPDVPPVGKTSPRHGLSVRSHAAPLWLYVVLLMLIGAKGIEVAGTLQDADNHAGLMLPFAPILRIAFAAFWLVLLAALIIGLQRRRAWAFHGCAPVLAFYAASHVLWQVIFFRADFDRGRLGFQFALSVSLVILLWLWTKWRGW